MAILRTIFLSAALGAFAGAPLAAEIRINEILAANRLANADEEGDSSDWLELVNAGAEPVRLGGLFLSDDPIIPQLWALPDQLLGPGEHFVVWCSGKNRYGREFHTNFRFDREGEVVLLADADGAIIDQVLFDDQTEDHSFGRLPDASGDFVYLLFPSPGKANGAPSSEAPIPAHPTVTPAAGRYAEALDVTIAAAFPWPEAVLRYTLDGSAPSPTSPIYARPIRIQRHTALRVTGYFGDRRITQVVTRSYFIGESTFDLPVISLVMRRSDFEFVHMSADGHGRPYERPAHIEFFDVSGKRVARADTGIRLHGGAGRFGPLEMKKSYRTYFRGAYGDPELDYPVIESAGIPQYDKLVLHTNPFDALRAGRHAVLLRDQVIRELHRDDGELIADGTWYHLFVNMQYRGLYNVTERIDKDFLEAHTGIDDAEWDVIRTFSEVHDGDGLEWASLLQFVRTADLGRADVFAEAERRIDIQNFTSYIITQVWSQNQDWPGNNWVAARPRHPNGRWTFFLWDTEFGMGLSPNGYTTDTFSHFLSGGRDIELSAIFVGLFQNLNYQRFFLQEVDRLFAGPLSSANVLAHVDDNAGRIDGDIAEDAAFDGGDPAGWPDGMEKVREFARLRNPVIREYIYASTQLKLPRVLRANPRRVEPLGETEVVLVGEAFSAESRIFFNDLPAVRTELVSSTLLRVVLPYDIRIDGFPLIALEDPAGPRFVKEGLLEVAFPRPEVTNMLPDSGSSAGGDKLRISGIRFLEGVEVYFGGRPALSVERFFGTDILLDVVSPPGSGTVDVLVVNSRPGRLPAATTLPFTYVQEGPPKFRRGDANGDTRINVSDGVVVLNRLFAPSFAIAAAGCDDALDADDSGGLNVTDAVYLLNYLFRAPSPPPRPPHPGCGADPTDDALPCSGHASCP